MMMRQRKKQMTKFYNRGKWKTFLKEGVQNPVKECGEMPPEPPMPSSVPVPSDDADPMALAAELGAIGLDPAMAQGVVDLLLSKGLLGTAVDPVDPVGAPPMMEYATPDNAEVYEKQEVELAMGHEAEGLARRLQSEYGVEGAVKVLTYALDTVQPGIYSPSDIEREEFMQEPFPGSRKKLTGRVTLPEGDTK
jgi:hypothetical protein